MSKRHRRTPVKQVPLPEPRYACEKSADCTYGEDYSTGYHSADELIYVDTQVRGYQPGQKMSLKAWMCKPCAARATGIPYGNRKLDRFKTLAAVMEGAAK